MNDDGIFAATVFEDENLMLEILYQFSKKELVKLSNVSKFWENLIRNTARLWRTLDWVDVKECSDPKSAVENLLRHGNYAVEKIDLRCLW
eukprot:CAMPEP_0196588982 /NCGR_PEP_ID=MMETSP1081-20130531/62297_1 /TAXON_ID=36882 /ORGANISM="Pyramimonas amylifera, Strain CCMP720" /LENGTH=89 /DNA_ID=CAMNT_0041911643 /DNA_START=187 /DNA_END=453 /DNA_ORIENTATION=-